MMSLILLAYSFGFFSNKVHFNFNLNINNYKLVFFLYLYNANLYALVMFLYIFVQSNILKIRKVYDAFLAEFPLCFGYWKKYADHVGRLDGANRVT